MTQKEIIAKKNYFQNVTWVHLSNCLKAFENRELLSASVWAAVFVESILKDSIRVLTDVKSSNDELSTLISRLRNILKNGSSQIDITAAEASSLEDIVRRSEEIRLKRNRLVHDTGVENQYLDSDADDIYKNVNQIVKQYLKLSISDIVFRNNNMRLHQEEMKQIEPDFPMFISTITPHNFEQSEFIEEFCQRLGKIGIKAVRCTLTDFDKKDPMEKVRRYIEKCKGIIVLGLERSHSYYYRDKEGSDYESEDMHRRYSSAWLQLETGMAIGMGKEVFVLCQKDLYGDGIFDRNWNSYVPVEIDVPIDINDKKIEACLQRLKKFRLGYLEQHKEEEKLEN